MVKERTLRYLKTNKIKQKELAVEIGYTNISLNAYLKDRATPNAVSRIELLLNLYLESKGF